MLCFSAWEAACSRAASTVAPDPWNLTAGMEDIVTRDRKFRSWKTKIILLIQGRKLNDVK